MCIETMLKNNFNKCRIYNGSDKTINEIFKIAEICKNCNELMVYIERNEKNNEYFDFIEYMESEKNKIDDLNIQLMIINKDNYVYFRDRHYNYSQITRMINKSLIDEDNCVVCYENEDIGKIICDECCSNICVKCIKQMGNLICPICKTNNSHLIREFYEK
jgi:hypothetical protein